jgi:hypothetical protein
MLLIPIVDMVAASVSLVEFEIFDATPMQRTVHGAVNVSASILTALVPSPLQSYPNHLSSPDPAYSSPRRKKRLRLVTHGTQTRRAFPDAERLYAFGVITQDA